MHDTPDINTNDTPLQTQLDRAGITQAALARELGIFRSQVSAWCSPRGRMSRTSKARVEAGIAAIVARRAAL